MSKNSSLLGTRKRECIILTDQNLAPCILDIIKNSKKYCFLITPYINLFKYWEHFTKILKEVSTNKKRIVFILKQIDENDEKDIEKIGKKKEEKNKVIEELNGKYNFDLFFVKYLHAKIFLNESEVLISSMNLTNFAKDNNYEIGCFISDPNTSHGIVEEIIFGKILKSKEEEHIKGISADWLEEQINGQNTTEKL